MNEKKTFSMEDFLTKRKLGKSLTSSEIESFVNGIITKEIPDYQASAFLMSCFVHPLSDQEVADLTSSMMNSGTTLNFKEAGVIDKHSTGGVGDKASFILAPIAASCGVKVPMIAGRGLGHTGGTVDKAEAIPGFKTSLPIKEFSENTIAKGLCLIGQTQDIAPADKILYALRDVTSTVDNIGLITASIMSKKLAEGAQGLVLDVKWGSGAFMQTQEDATNLAKSLITTAKAHNKKIVALISDMNQPLGHAIGHSVEIKECLDVLKGEGPADIRELSLELAAHMILLAEMASSIEEARRMAQESIQNGQALKKFNEMIDNQGGDSTRLTDPTYLKVAKSMTLIKASQEGYIHSINNKEIGLNLIKIGGGRTKTADKIDHSVGFVIPAKIGQQVKKGDILGRIYHHEPQQQIVDKIVKNIQESIVIKTQEAAAMKLIVKTLR